MRTKIVLLLVVLMAHPAFHTKFDFGCWLEKLIAKITLNRQAEGRERTVRRIRRRLADLCRLRLYRTKDLAAAYLTCILMCVSLTTLPSKSSILANVVEGGTIVGKLTDPSGEPVVAAHVIATIQSPSTLDWGAFFLN